MPSTAVSMPKAVITITFEMVFYFFEPMNAFVHLQNQCGNSCLYNNINLVFTKDSNYFFGSFVPQMLLQDHFAEKVFLLGHQQ
jgi:hypothetical protein